MAKNYTIYSDKNLQYQEELERILSEYKDSNFDLINIDLSDDSMISLLNEIESIPFIYDFKVIVLQKPMFLYDSSYDAKLVDGLTKFLNSPSDSSILITLITKDEMKLIDSIKKSEKFSESMRNVLTAYEEKTNIIKLTGFKPEDYDNVINKRLDGFKMSQRAIDELKSRTENDMYRILVEIDKLKIYKNEEREITLDDVILLVSRDLEDKAYNFSQALIERRRNDALLMYSDFKKTGIDQGTLLQVVINKIIELYQVKILSNNGFDKKKLAEYYNISEGRAYYMLRDSSKYGLAKLKEEIHNLIKMDYNKKAGLRDLDSSLELYILAF